MSGIEKIFLAVALSLALLLIIAAAFNIEDSPNQKLAEDLIRVSSEDPPSTPAPVATPPPPFTVLNESQAKIEPVVGVKATPNDKNRNGNWHIDTMLSILTAVDTTTDRMFQISVPTETLLIQYDVPATEPAFAIVTVTEMPLYGVVVQCGRRNCFASSLEIHLHSRSELH